MSEPSTRVPVAWIVTAHALGAAAVGVLESVRVAGASLAMTLVPLFAATGAVVGGVVAAATWFVRGRRPAIAAVGLAAPSLLVTGPMAATLFEGAYAQTLPLAGAMPVLLPLLAWAGVAASIAAGRRLVRDGLRISRGLAILGCALAIGIVAWIERRVLGSGYPGAHAAAAIAVIVLVGVIVRLVRSRTVPRVVAIAVSSAALGTSIVALVDGLDEAGDRRALAVRGRHGASLVKLWRAPFDDDDDGAATVLGGHDCDDGDPARYPGAADLPGDGIDQDCDGVDTALVADRAPAAPASLDLERWRASPGVAAVLDRARSMNVLLITVDALRFDVLAPGTGDRDELPNLVRLLDDSVWFTHAFAPGAGTDISLGTLLTGRENPFQPIEVTLPEALQTTGRATTSAFPVEVYRYVGDTILTRGVDTAKRVHTDWGKNDVGDHVSAPATTAVGLDALSTSSTPWFVWLHYFDVHEHHQIDVPKSLRDAVTDAGGMKRHRYRALLKAIDNEIGRLRQALVDRGVADRTILVFASDHGESLGEDPRLGDTHGKVAYASLVRIPFAFHVPGVAGAQRTDPASLVDVAPTLLSLLGAPTAMQPLDGRDLVPALLGAPDELRQHRRPLIVHEELQWSVVDWPLQLIVRPAEDLVELYDLDADPTQTRDLAASREADVNRLRARYAEVPAVKIDRTSEGRRWREHLAQPPTDRARRPGSAATPTP